MIFSRPSASWSPDAPLCRKSHFDREMFLNKLDLYKLTAALSLRIAGLASVMAVLSHRDIIALESDASVAINMSLGYLAGEYPPYYPPGSAFYISAVRGFGIPLRLANILLTYGCATFAALVIATLIQSPIKRIVIATAFAIFFSLIPTIIYEGDITGNVYFSAVVNLTLYLLLAAGISKASNRYVLAFCIVPVAALAAISRPDTEILKVSLVGVLGLVLIIPWMRQTYGRPAVTLLLLALTSVFAAEVSVKRFNISQYGVDAVASYLDSRYSDLFATIASLPSDTATDRYFLADEPRRQLAYRLSPTLAKFQSAFESRSGVGAIGFDAGIQFFQKADIANAFFYWHVDNTLKAAGYSDRQYLPMLGTAADEIRQAARAQQLPLKPPFFGVLTRDVGLWIPHLWTSLQKIYQHSFRERSHPVSYGTASPELISAYDRAALRRAALKDQPPAQAHNYAGLFSTIHAVIFWTFPLVAVIGVLCLGRSAQVPLLQVLLLIFVVSFVARIGYYMLLDAALYRATINYLMPNFVLVYPIWLCSVILIFQRMRDLYAGRQPSPLQ
jgi:hypothetical protein